MQESYTLSKHELQEKLQAFYSEQIEPHGIVDEMSLREYKRLRHKLSILLDELAYPIAKLDYNGEETEWHDVWDGVSIVFEDMFGAQDDQKKISREQLLNFKQRLLDELDNMTEQ